MFWVLWEDPCDGHSSYLNSMLWTTHTLCGIDNSNVCLSCLCGLAEGSVRNARESALCIAKLSKCANCYCHYEKVFSTLRFVVIGYFQSNSRGAFGYLLPQRPSLILKSTCLQLLNWKKYYPISIVCYLGNQDHFKILEREQYNWEEKHTLGPITLFSPKD